MIRQGTRGPVPRYCSDKCKTDVMLEKRAARRAAGERPGRPTGNQNLAKRRRAENELAKGVGVSEAAARAGLSEPTARAIAKQVDTPKPIPFEDLSPEARRALEDFGYFRERYFGRVPTPWQTMAGETLKDAWESPVKEYIVLNAPPGVGKSTLFVHDLVAWLAVRDRSIRVLIGSKTFRMASTYTNRLRRTFARETPAPVSSEDVAKGSAVEPVSTLSKDFGPFQPTGRDQWTAGEFVLLQDDGLAVSEKESSFAAYGMDSGFLGGRYGVVVWDDLVQHKTIRTQEGREGLIRLYEDEMETRVEPGGLLVLQGQRLDASDLYRHCLDMQAGDDEGGLPTKKYWHIVYRAHNDEKCRGAETHGPDAPAWPEGCLLDPKRLSWPELVGHMANRMEKYEVLYQQQDVDPANVLVPRLWIDGGRDMASGGQLPGCWDKNRGLAEIPAGLVPPLHSIATVDPSPTKYWSIQWWAWHPATEQRFLLDLVREKMDAPEFLDFDYAKGVHTGVMEDWQTRSAALGLPIEKWIIEANAAQRFLLQFDHVRTWQGKHRVAIQAHQTQRNKTDAEYGVQSIAPHYQFGRVRLPAGGLGDEARRASMRLVDEVTRYPDSQTDDCVMAHWFLEWWLPRLYPKTSRISQPARRPSWIQQNRKVPAR